MFSLKSLRIKLINDLKVSRGSFFAVWFVVMLGVAFYGAMYPAGVNLRESFNETSDSLAHLDFQVSLEPTEAGISADAAVIEHVSAVEERLTLDAGVQLDLDSPFRVTLRMSSLPDDREPTVNQLDVVDGESISAEEEILLLDSFARTHDIDVGDTLIVWLAGEPNTFTVAGRVFSAEYVIPGRSAASPYPTPSSFGVAWVNYSTLAQVSGLEGLVNEVVVTVAGATSEDRDDALAAVEADLRAAYGDLDGYTLAARDQTPSGSVVQSLLSGNFPVLYFFSGVFLFGSVIMTGILLGRVVQGERQRIGTMRAMGVTRRELVVHYLSYGVVIGVTGGIVGTLVGYLNSLWVAAVFIELIVRGPLPAFSNELQVVPLALGFVIALVGSIMAGVYPAWVESATPPGVALRPAAPNRPSKLSQLSLPFLPLTARRAVRNVLRSPGRSIGTALGVALGAMMIFSAFSMWDSNETGTGAYFGSLSYDIRVDLDTLTPIDSIEGEVQAIDGVARAQGALIGPVIVTNPAGDGQDGYALSLDETDSIVDLTTLRGEAAFSRDDGVWIGTNLERLLEIEVGDTITITALGQSNEVEVLGVVSQTVGVPVYMPRSLFTQWTPGGLFPVTSVFVTAEDGQRDAVRDALLTLDGVVAIELVREFKTDIEGFLLFFRGGTLIFGLFGYLLTLAVLFNTVNAGLRERQGELAVLRALGTSGREIATIVLLELLLMTVVGAAIGLPMGRLVGFGLLAEYHTVAFAPIPNVLALSYVAAFLTLVVIVVVATWPGLRSVQQVDLGAVSKSQSL